MLYVCVYDVPNVHICRDAHFQLQLTQNDQFSSSAYCRLNKSYLC